VLTIPPNPIASAYALTVAAMLDEPAAFVLPLFAARGVADQA
jgi:hypothetical protein